MIDYGATAVTHSVAMLDKFLPVNHTSAVHR